MSLPSVNRDLLTHTHTHQIKSNQINQFLLSISRRLRTSAATASTSSSHKLIRSTSSIIRELQKHISHMKQNGIQYWYVLMYSNNTYTHLGMLSSSHRIVSLSPPSLSLDEQGFFHGLGLFPLFDICSPNTESKTSSNKGAWCGQKLHVIKLRTIIISCI